MVLGGVSLRSSVYFCGLCIEISLNAERTGIRREPRRKPISMRLFGAKPREPGVKHWIRRVFLAAVRLPDSDCKHRDGSPIESLHWKAYLVAFSLLRNHVEKRQIMIGGWN